MKSAVWKTLLMYGVGLGLLAYIIIATWNPRDGRPGLVDVIRRPIHVGPLFLAGFIGAVALIITCLRWHMLVRAVGLPFSKYNAIRLGLVGYYFNAFMPGSVGGDILKAYSIAREQSRQTVAVATVIIDRVIGLWALIWLLSLVGGMFWLFDDPLVKNGILLSIIRYSAFVLVGSLAIWFGFGFLPERRAHRFAERLAKVAKIGGSLAEFWRACWMYRRQSRSVFVAIFVTLFSHTLWVLVFHFSVQAFEAPDPAKDIGTLTEHMIVVPVGMTAQALIPLPGGIGAGEVAFGKLYKIIHKDEANGIAGCMSQRIVYWGLGIIGYIVYTRMRSGTVRGDRSLKPEVDAPPDPDPDLEKSLPNAVVSP